MQGWILSGRRRALSKDGAIKLQESWSTRLAQANLCKSFSDFTLIMFVECCPASHTQTPNFPYMVAASFKVVRRDIMKIVKPIVEAQLKNLPAGMTLLQRIDQLIDEWNFLKGTGHPPFSDPTFWGAIRSYLWAHHRSFAVLFPEAFLGAMPLKVVTVFAIFVRYYSICCRISAHCLVSSSVSLQAPASSG